MWLSFIITVWSSGMLCLCPPPIATASVSKILKPGAVFLVEYSPTLGFAARIFFSYVLVWVAMPLILDIRFSAVLSRDKAEYVSPVIVSIFWFGDTVCPSLLCTKTLQFFDAKISLAYDTPATIPFSRDMIYAVIFFLGSNLLVISPLLISSARNFSSCFFALGCNLCYLECILAFLFYSKRFGN